MAVAAFVQASARLAAAGRSSLCGARAGAFSERRLRGGARALSRIIGAVGLVLSFTPLSRAYPFVALAFVITPILAALVLFPNRFSMRLMIGIARDRLRPVPGGGLTMDTIVIVIAAYNEAKVIAGVVRDVVAIGHGHPGR